MPAYPHVLTRPPRTTRVFSRQRLTDEVLDRDHAGAVLIGPAGSGKTTVALDAAAGHGGRVAWLRLAPGFGHARDLVALARRSARGDAGDEPPPEDASASMLARADGLLELLDETPTVLIIDDYHHAEGDETDPLVAEIIGLVSPESRIVICSRERPAGLIGRLGLAGASPTAVIGAGELAFTRDEITEVLTANAVEHPDDRSAAVLAATNGWATAVMLSTRPSTEVDVAPWHELVTALVTEGDAGEHAVVDALVALPYLTPAVAARLGIDDASIRRLESRTMLATTDDGTTRLTDAARSVLRTRLDPARAAALVAAAAPDLAATDPSTAIDLLLDTGQPERAADMLATSLSAIGTDHAVRWLYRLPAELRHRFPPLLAAGQATVDLDEALADAQRRVDEATDEHTRREALLALGSALAHRGSLGAAAHALESASAGGTDDQLNRVSTTWLGIVRWWAGDLVGARTALGEAGAGDDDLARWARAEVALALGDLEAAERATASTDASQVTTTSRPALAGCVAARIAWDRGDSEQAAALALDAYEQGSVAGGFDLAAASPAYLWWLVNGDRCEEAEAIADHLDRRVGRSDVFTRVHVTLVQLAVARSRGDRAAAARAEQRLADHRALGFAPIEAEARRRLSALQATTDEGLVIRVLGPTILTWGGREIATKWKSRKALEVVLYLALVHGRTATREQIIEAVWPERDPDKGRTLLRTALSEIRRTLEPGRPTGEASSFLETSADRVSLHAATDYEAARTLAASAAYVAAFDLFRGGLLDEDPYLEWVFDLRRHAESFRFELAERIAADAEAATADRARALEFIVAEQSWDESRWNELERLHRDTGDAAAANDVRRRHELMLERSD